MHLVANTATKLLSLRQERQKRFKRLLQASALKFPYASFLATYIKRIFLLGELLREEVKLLQKLDSLHSQKLAFNKQTTFQKRFIQEQSSYIAGQSCNSFQIENQLAFYAYNYSANIKIKVNKQLQLLPKETCLCVDNNNSNSNSKSYSNNVEDSALIESIPSQKLLRTNVNSKINYQALYTNSLNQL